MLDRATVAAAGARDVLLRLGRTGGRSAPVLVTVDYSGFRTAYGGDWASRLHLSLLPECALGTPGRPGWAGRPVTGSRNNPAASVVSGMVDVAGSDGVVLLLDGGASGRQGTTRPRRWRLVDLGGRWQFGHVGWGCGDGLHVDGAGVR